MSRTSKPDLAAQIDRSLGQRLMRVARLYNERAIEEINRQAGRPLLRPSLTQAFPHIAFEGVRVTELARRLGVSKQAASQIVAELVEQRVVELVPDPSDARAKLVRWSSFGRDALLHGLGVLAKIEEGLAAKVGRKKLAELGEVLAEMEAMLS